MSCFIFVKQAETCHHPHYRNQNRSHHSHHHRQYRWWFGGYYFSSVIYLKEWKWAKSMKAKIKGGKKWTIDRLKSAVILKTPPKHVFLVPKVPQKRGVIFCPPPFLGLFLREKKWFSARCGAVDCWLMQLSCNGVRLLSNKRRKNSDFECCVYCVFCVTDCKPFHFQLHLFFHLTRIRPPEHLSVATRPNTPPQVVVCGLLTASGSPCRLVASYVVRPTDGF